MVLKKHKDFLVDKLNVPVRTVALIKVLDKQRLRFNIQATRVSVYAINKQKCPDHQFEAVIRFNTAVLITFTLSIATAAYSKTLVTPAARFL